MESGNNKDRIFPWNDNDAVLEEYKKDNYSVLSRGGKRRQALIFFSSHALYYPNTEKAFRESIVTKNRYEWSKIGKNLFLHARYSKIIWVRDVYKQWYIKGINVECDTISKLSKLLMDLTAEYDSVVLCGVSAGGYAACVCGILMGTKVSHIISISGQMNLIKYCNSKNPLLEEKILLNRNYFDINSLIKEKQSSVKIYYLYSAYCDEDVEQGEFVNCENVKKIAFNSCRHGSPINKRSYIHLLLMRERSLDRFAVRHKDRIVKRIYL